MATDQHDIRMTLGYARSDRAYADFGNELDTDPRAMVAFFRSWISCARSSIE